MVFIVLTCLKLANDNVQRETDHDQSLSFKKGSKSSPSGLQRYMELSVHFKWHFFLSLLLGVLFSQKGLA